MATKVPTAPPTDDTDVPIAIQASASYSSSPPVSSSGSRRTFSSILCCISPKLSFDEALRAKGFQGSDIEFDDIIIAGQNQVDTSKLKNMLRLKVFITHVNLPKDPYIKCCGNCYISPFAFNLSNELSPLAVHCNYLGYWLSCFWCGSGISYPSIEKSKQKEFLLKPSIQYDGVTFKFWKSPGYLGVRIDGNEKKVVLELDKFVRIDDLVRNKQYAIYVTDVYDER